MVWAARYALEHRPDVIVHLGDHWDMPSLSSYDSTHAKVARGCDILSDIQAGNSALARFDQEIVAFNRRQNARRRYKPRKIMLRGNHEERIQRAIADDPMLSELLAAHPLESPGWEVVPFLHVVCVDQISYCLHPDHKVLTAGLQYIPLRDLTVGMELTAFDEHNPAPRTSRRYKTSTVERVEFSTAPLYAVTDSRGKTFRVTADHLWLARKNNRTSLRWVATRDLRPGVDTLVRCMPEWTQLRTYEAGWLGGMFDGEGWITRPNTKQGGIQVGIAQNPGLVQDALERELTGIGAKFRVFAQNGSNALSTGILGPSGHKLKLLAQINAIRLLDKFKPEMLGRVQSMDNEDVPWVESVTPLGVGPIAQVQTTSGTLIVEGYAHHNCHFYPRGANGCVMQSKRGAPSARAQCIREGRSATAGHKQGLDVARVTVGGGRVFRGIIAGSFEYEPAEYKSPQGQSYWRGILHKRNVRDGDYDLTEVHFDTLRARYG